MPDPIAAAPRAPLPASAAEAPHAGSLRRALLTVSHDLRTPLTGLCALVSMLETGADGELTAAQSRRVARIRESCGRLIDLVQEIGELARLESGGAALQRVSMDAALVAGGVCEELTPAARDRLIELRLVAAPSLPMLEADPDRLRRLFRLILSAALVTAEGSVLELSLGPADGGIAVALREIRGSLPLEAVSIDAATESATAPLTSLTPAFAALMAEAILRAHGGRGSILPAAGATDSSTAFFLPARDEGGPLGSGAEDGQESNA